MSYAAIFTINLNQKILPGLVTLGKYTDDVPNLTVVTTSNKINIYNLQTCENRNLIEDNTLSLNFTQPISGIEAVRFQGEDSDFLMICTQTRVFVYDIHKNQDVFTREVKDGGNVVKYGMIAKTELVLVGGNCSVQGYDKNGADLFWIVAGDNVRSLAMVDVDNDGEDELVVGSDDYDIRVFRNEDLVYEITETQIVTHLLSIGNGLFAYSLANGTIGVYERLNRLWRVKSKNRATYLHLYDINNDGVIELITGWQGGKVDGRNIKTGEVIFKDNFANSIAGICEGDCRDTGKNDLIVISITGEIKVYNPNMPRRMKEEENELSYEQETIRELLSRKQELLLELKNYECNVKYVDRQADETEYGAIPAKTRLQTSIGVSSGFGNRVPHVQVGLSTNNDTIIRAVIVFAEGIFKGETHVKHPKLFEVENNLNISLYPPRDVPTDIHIKALVGYRESKQFHVFQLTRQLPRFSMYAAVDVPPTKTLSSVSFTLKERIQRVMLWVNRNFLLNQPFDINTSADLKLYMISLRDEKEMAICMDQLGKVKIQTDNIALAGDLIQSLAAYLNLEHLKSYADFHKEEEKCVELLEKLRDLESVREKLNLDLGDKSNLIRDLLIRSEDSRLLQDWDTMKKFYSELDDVNATLRRGYDVRVANYNDSVNAMKELNGIVEKASRLRYGKYKTDTVALSKTAISTYNPKSLINAIRNGEA